MTCLFLLVKNQSVCTSVTAKSKFFCKPAHFKKKQKGKLNRDRKQF